MTTITTSLIKQSDQGEEAVNAADLIDLSGVYLKVDFDHGARTFNIDASWAPSKIASVIAQAQAAYEQQASIVPQVAALQLLMADPAAAVAQANVH